MSDILMRTILQHTNAVAARKKKSIILALESDLTNIFANLLRICEKIWLLTNHKLYFLATVLVLSGGRHGIPRRRRGARRWRFDARQVSAVDRDEFSLSLPSIPFPPPLLDFDESVLNYPRIRLAINSTSTAFAELYDIYSLGSKEEVQVNP